MFVTYSTTPRARVDGEQFIARGSSMGVVLVTQVGTTGGAMSAAQSTDISNTLRSTALSTASGTISGTTTVQTLLAANTARKAATFSNGTGALLLIDATSSPTTQAHQVQIAASGGYYELPQPVYTGAIYGLLATASTLLITAREYI